MASDGKKQMNGLLSNVEPTASEQAMKGFAKLMHHVCELYTCGESSSVSESEGYQIAESVLYVLGLNEKNVQQTILLLADEDVIAIWNRKRCDLEMRIPGVMELWKRVITIMPAIRNIALRDTLTSIGTLPKVYDTFFAAYEVPVNIDYPLSRPVTENLKGLDYVETWLQQLLIESEFLTKFDIDEMVAYLDSWCPDYRGLHINLYEPIREAWRAGAIHARLK